MAFRKKALLLFPLVPDVQGNGLAQRCALFVEAAMRVADVDVCILPVFRTDTEARRRFASTYPVRLHPDLSEFATNTQFSLLMRLRDTEARLAAFREFSRPSVNAPLGAPLQTALCDQLGNRQYDLIHVSRSYCAPVTLFLSDTLQAKNNHRPALLLDLDEDDASFQRRLAALYLRQGNRTSALWAKQESVAFDQLIRQAAPCFDRIWTSSRLESSKFSEAYGVSSISVPNSVATTPEARRDVDDKTILFVGSFEHLPNVEGMEWFLERIWPLLSHRKLTLKIIGKSPPDWLIRAGRRPGVEVIDWVRDLLPHYQKAGVAIAPLTIGAGTRIKLLDYAAHGIPIVTTSTGAEGLGLVNGRDVKMADTPDRFAAAIVQSLKVKADSDRLARNARKFLARHHDRQTVIASLASRFCEVLTQR